MNDETTVLLIQHLRVINANAISGPISYGFPSPTAFTGFADALSLKLKDKFDVELGGCGVVCHSFDEQVTNTSTGVVFNLYRAPRFSGWKRKWSEGQSAMVEEGRVHLDVSLLIEVKTELHDDDKDDIADAVSDVVPTMRFAGGRIVDFKPVEMLDIFDEKVSKRLKRKLLPGFTLVDRPDVLAEKLASLRERSEQATALDAMLGLCRLDWAYNGEEWAVSSSPGWFVPTVVGYAGISDEYEAGIVASTRDATVPFQFCEPVYGVGQWVSPHRISDFTRVLWRRSEKDGLYTCVTTYANS